MGNRWHNLKRDSKELGFENNGKNMPLFIKKK